MGNYRIDRINEQFTNEMAIILRNIKDPRIARNFISVTHCSVTPDLKYAKIYYSVMEQGKPIDHKAVKQGLYSAAGYIRRCLASKLNLRITPELSFLEDSSMAHGAKISALLHGVEESLRAADARDAAEAQSSPAEREEANDETFSV